MKTIYDFIYCDDAVLTPRVVFYLVSVGASERDRHCRQAVERRCNDHRFLFVPHSLDMQCFVERCAASLFPSDGVLAVSRLRRRYVSVVWLASFLRRCPASLLNSPHVATGRPLL